MTSLTVPAPAAFQRPPSRADLIWAAWRRHRLTIWIMLAGFAASALWLGVTGLQTHIAYDHYVSRGCIANYVTNACWHLLGQSYDITWVVSLLPWIAGVFIAAPLTAGEFESGSHPFAVTQGVSWRRQITTQLLLFGGIVVAGGCLLGGLAIWSKNPMHLVATGSYTGISYWSAGYFGITPVVLPVTALLDFSLGAASGALIRRTVPAMAVTAAAVLAVTALTTGFGVTDHGNQTYGPLASELLRIDTATMRGSQPNQWQGPLGFLDNGHSVRVIELYHLNQRPWLWRGSQQAQATYYYPAGVSGTRDTVWVAGWFTGPQGHLSARTTQLMFDRLLPRTFATSASVLSWLRRWFAARAIGYRIAYQPASHYWPIQAMLGAILLALAMLAGCGTVLLSQRGGAPAAGKRRRAFLTGH